VLVEAIKEERAPPDVPSILGVTVELNVLVLQSAADEDLAAMPLDEPVLVDTSDLAEWLEVCWTKGRGYLRGDAV
jgi:hypothetical protein